MTADELNILWQRWTLRMKGQAAAPLPEYLPDYERLRDEGWLSRRMVNGDAVYEFTDTGLQRVEAGALVNRTRARVN